MAIFTSPTYFDCIEHASKRAASFGVSLDTKIILFCEDKLTLSLEKALVKNAGGAFGAEVYSFGRYTSLNAKSRKALSKEGSAMAVKKILTSLKGQMKALCNRGASPTLATKTAELIAQLKSAKITPKMLLDCVESCPITVANKIHDVGLCFSEYEKFLEENNLTDSSNSLSDMLPALENDQNIRQTRVIIVGYSSVTKQSCEIMEKLYDLALSVDFFAITGENEDLYTNEFLNFALKLTGEKPTPTNSRLSFEAKRLLDRLYRADKYSEVGLYSDKLHIYEAKTITDEVDYAVAYIQNLIIKNGYRYSDFALAVGNVNDYLPILERRLNDYQIPFFADKKRTLASHPIANLCYNAIKSATTKRDLTDVKKVITSSLFISEKALSDKFVRLLIENSVTYKSFLSGASFIPEEKGAINFDNTILLQKRQILADFINNFPMRSTASNYATIIENFITTTTGCKSQDKDTNFALLCKKLTEIGAEEERSFLEGGVGNFYAILNEIKQILGEEILSADEFLKLLVAGEEASEISLIPEYYDCVYLSEIKNCRYKKYSVLIVMGLSGEVPLVKADTALLMDSDISKLDELSLSIEPKIRVVNDREKEATALALASFEDKLVLTHSLTNASGKTTIRSEILDYIENIFSDDIYDEDKNLLNGKHLFKATASSLFADYDDKNEDYAEAFYYSSLHPATLKLLTDGDDYKNGFIGDLVAPSSFYSALKEIQSEEFLTETDSLINKLNEKPIEKAKFPFTLYFDKDRVSATIIEQYFSCPYKCFLKYGIGIQDSISSEIRALDFGNIMHKIAENFTPLLGDINSVYQCITEANRLINDILAEPKYSKFLQREDYAYSCELLKKEAEKLCIELFEESQSSKFKNVGNEVSFGKWSEHKTISFKTKSGVFTLTGKVDRVDEYGDYVRIIDYKTGKASDKSKNEKFYSGQNLQLYLYLNAFAKNGKKPAGAYYYAVNDDFISEQTCAMFGKTRFEEEVLKASDKAFEENDEFNSKIVDAKKKNLKKGTTYSGNLAKDDSLEYFMKYAKYLTQSAVNDILDGVIIPSPYQKTCDYCEFGGICGRDCDTGFKERSVSEIKDEVIVNAVKELEKEENDG